METLHAPPPGRSFEERILDQVAKSMNKPTAQAKATESDIASFRRWIEEFMKPQPERTARVVNQSGETEFVDANKLIHLGPKRHAEFSNNPDLKKHIVTVVSITP